MKRSAFISTAAVLLAAADAAGSSGAVAGKPAKTETKAPVDAKADASKAKITTEVVGISTAVAMPERAGRGSKNKYPFASLEVGQSIVVKGAKAENLGSTLATANRNESFKVFKRDEAGNIVRKHKEIKDANGNVTQTIPNAGEPVKLSQRVFFAVDCDASKDPDGADVRIFRDHDKTFND